MCMEVIYLDKISNLKYMLITVVILKSEHEPIIINLFPLYLDSYGSFFIQYSKVNFFSIIDRSPVFNVGAKKLDTTSCFQNRCPPYNYPSNDIDVGMYCIVYLLKVV